MLRENCLDPFWKPSHPCVRAALLSARKMAVGFMEYSVGWKICLPAAAAADDGRGGHRLAGAAADVPGDAAAEPGGGAAQEPGAVQPRRAPVAWRGDAGALTPPHLLEVCSLSVVRGVLLEAGRVHIVGSG